MGTVWNLHKTEINPFHATGLLLLPLKTSDVFRGYVKRSVIWLRTPKFLMLSFWAKSLTLLNILSYLLLWKNFAPRSSRKNLFFWKKSVQLGKKRLHRKLFSLVKFFVVNAFRQCYQSKATCPRCEREARRRTQSQMNEM